MLCDIKNNRTTKRNNSADDLINLFSSVEFENNGITSHPNNHHFKLAQKDTNNVVENNRVEFVFGSYKTSVSIFSSATEAKSKKNHVP